MLADRKSGQCIVTSSRQGQASMLDSDEQLRPLRDRARAVLGGSMQVEQWEIAVMFRTQHGECCRVTWLRGDPDAMVESLCEIALPRLKQVREFCSASLLVNRSTRLRCITTAWESRTVMETGHEAADDMRRLLEAVSSGDSVEVHEATCMVLHAWSPVVLEVTGLLCGARFVSRAPRLGVPSWPRRARSV